MAPTGFHDLLAGEAFGLAPYPLDCSARALHADPQHQRLMRRPVRRAVGLTRYWLRVSFLDAPDRVRTGLLDTLADADVVGSHPTMAMVTAPICRHFVADRPGAFTFAPVAHVLPRCRAAIVSGALGTLAAALGNGVPVVVLPQLFDQVWHGGQVSRLGVGALARSPAGAVGAVARLEAEPSYAERARALAAAMAGEDGAAALADAFEETVLA